MTAHISGHIDLTEEEFKEHYIPLIEEAMAKGHDFVVGDARGCDTVAMKYIHSRNMVERLTVYHMFTSPRNYVEGAWRRSGYSTDEERDAAMTGHSDYDIAWIRPGREKSGTAKNLKRRLLKNGPENSNS